MRKKTIDNSVRYVPINEKANETESKPKTTKTGSLHRKQNKNNAQNNFKILKNVAAGRFASLTK